MAVWRVVVLINLVSASKLFYRVPLPLSEEHEVEVVKRNSGGDLISASYDIIKGFPENQVVIGFHNTDKNFIKFLLKKLESGEISVMFFNMSVTEVQDKYFEYLAEQTENNLPVTTMFFGPPRLYQHILIQVYAQNSIRRNLVYIFNWGANFPDEYFRQNMHYAMRIVAITNPRFGTFRINYNQAVSNMEHHLKLINWWNEDTGLFHHPTLPQKVPVFKNFHKKVLQVPVLHKPPWFFVRYNLSDNKSLDVFGGRDDRILRVLSNKLNFRYNYYDPPQRILGSSENQFFNGVIGQVAQRKADLLIGDMGITYERSKVVEFSFITLADSGAFVTHAPSRLNEALALLRPFQWQVWPAIGITCLIVGPVLYALIALPNAWQPRFLVRSHARLFFDCTWFTITILLKQTGKEISSTHKSRMFIIILSFSATYVITDMYSANLTSLLARPGREKAINNLYQLKAAMESTNYKLFVEKHSPSFGLLKNDTGIYGQIWEIMERSQSKFVVDSVEEGVKLVNNSRNVAVMAGRETLFFDIQRFGSMNFHLSEKLNTAYSAIALQPGCPYIEEINKILMAIFEAGIISKMTENEYENLGKKQKIPEAKIRENEAKTTAVERVKAAEDDKLKPISLKMLQGTFYILFIGNAFSGLVLLNEIAVNKYRLKYRKKKKQLDQKVKKVGKRVKHLMKRAKNNLSRIYRNFMHDAITMTLEYIE